MADRERWFIYYNESEGTDGAATNTHTCPDNTVEKIIGAWMYHNKAGALTGRWILYDDAGAGHEIMTDLSITAGMRVPLYGTYTGLYEPLILRDGQRLQASITGIAAGEHVYILIWAERLTGMLPNG